MSKSASAPIALDSFARRQFDDPAYHGTKIPISPTAFMTHVLCYYSQRQQVADQFPDAPVLVDGYAPFCKHIFMPNFVTGIVDGAVRITDDNRGKLRTEYEARRSDELPVLKRFFLRHDVDVPESKFLDLILYSREQIEKENRAMGKVVELEAAPWRLISIKGQAVPYEIPMEPITMMRNELISQGGSGVPIDRDAYMKSVEYWRDHAMVV
eukprot:GFKZ01012774.1.p1 GENE.GFKZ01012774.1~~GFKZ01012774.1.p1  ORF type:complete len:242 (-),score=33.49 GFKZ01012774.1:777-1409(-)